MNALRAQLVVLRPRHEPFADALIHHKDDLGSDLGAQETRLLHPDIFPLGKVIRHFEQLNARRRLRMTRVLVGLHLLLLLVLLQLELLMQLLLRLSGRSEIGIGGCGCGEEERVDAWSVVCRRVMLRLGSICSCRRRGCEVGWQF